jgi:murein DD-endopeptidase MepM/ murein hydrolase activator NlpD
MAVAALHADFEDSDCRFGIIHPRQHVVAFSLSAHWRILLALLILTIGSSLLATEVVRNGDAILPKPHKSVVLARSRRQASATPKSGRVWVPRTGDLPPKLDLLERMGDGSLAHSSYFDVSLDLGTAQDSSPHAALSYQEPDQAGQPFSLLLRPSHADVKPASLTSELAQKSGRLAPILGEPINVSVAPVKPALPVRRLVSMPSREEPLSSIEGAVNIPERELATLAQDLGSRSIKAGEELDLLVRKRSADSDELQIIFVRHRTKRGSERILARRDDGHFQKLDDRHLYDRLLAEALALGQDGSEGGARNKALAGGSDKSRSDDAVALSRAQADFPLLVARLRQSKVPARVGVQVVDLLRKNGIAWHKSQPEPVIDVVYRKTDGAGEELVSVKLRQAGQEQHFYRYAAADESAPEYFDDSGRSMSKLLMHKPVPAGTLGDGFGWRVHPILKVRKFHNGVDYRAPAGSPIVAAGDGVIVKISSEWGYGKYVRIRHDGGYTTTYAHIAGTPKGLAVGQRVSQGQVIAYVGSTGLSTGPHLYYELRLGDKYADPTKVQMAAGTSLRGQALDKFHQEVDRVEAIATAIRSSAASAAHAVAHAFRPDHDRNLE